MKLKKKYGKNNLELRSVVLSLMLGLSASKAFAQNQTSINENSEFVSRVATKKLERIVDSPATVSVVTEEEIQKFGANSLVDVLNRVTSMYVVSTYAYPNNMVSIRGDATDQYNNRILITLDGRAVKESSFLGDNRSILEMFPLSSIKRIEVMRGPGSLVYGGSTAFEGVINIVTKGWEKDETRVQVSGGSFNRSQQGLRVAQKIGETEVNLDLNAVKDGGWDLKMVDERSYERSTPMKQNGFGVNGLIKNSGFKLALLYTEDKQGTIGNTPIWGPDKVPSSFTAAQKSDLQTWDYYSFSKRMYVDAGYEVKVSDSWNSRVDLNFQKYNFKFGYDQAIQDSRLARADDNSLIWVNEFTLNPEWSASVGLIAWNRKVSGEEPAFNAAGSAYDIYSSAAVSNQDPFKFIPETQEDYYSGHLALDYRPTTDLRFNGGVRINKAPALDTDYVPQLGMVYSINSAWTTKLLYGETFRAPSVSERFRVSTSAIGDKNLLPEKSKTVEAELAYNVEHLLLTGVLFQTDGNNLIGRSAPDSTGASRYQNASKSKTQGMELEAKYNTSDWIALGSVSYAWVNYGDSNSTVTGMPRWLVKAGGSYNYTDYASLGLFDQYVGPAAQGSASTANPSADGYHWFTAQARFELNKVFKTENPLVFSVYGQNLLNQSVYYTEYVRQKINTIPGRPGSSVYASLSYDF